MLIQKIKHALDLIRFSKPIGTALLLWPTLVSLFLAEKQIPNLKLLVIFSLAVFIARSAGCVINDIADHKIDPLVERTKNRPLANGSLMIKDAWILFWVLILILFILVLQLNLLTILLSIVALFFMMIYPFSKRFFVLPQIFLGLTFGFCAVIAFSAIKNQIVLDSFLIYTIVLIWTFYFDTIYALVDLKDDLKTKIHSSAIFLGNSVFTTLLVLQILIFVSIAALGLYFDLNLKYYVGLVFIALSLIYQNNLLRSKNEKSFFKAFLHNHYLGLFWFLATIFGIS